MTTTTTHAADKLPPLRDPNAFVKAMAKAASALAVDLVARAKDARIEPSLLESYADEKAAGRTGEDFLTWRNAFCDQVAASWVLCTVFVRTLEDRGFLRHRVAGPGAADRLAQFQRMFRFLSERDYLRQVFDALAEPPPSWPRDRPADDWVGAQVFGRSSAPLWRLSPSAGALSAMLDALRAVDAEGTLLFTFGRPEGVEHDGSTTRFLGDLYQDLNEGVRKRYALLQTPDFVERFILDQTLTPALHERGIAVTVCDPTCGSGHFLLGAYDRLFEARTRQEPGRSATERARKALSQVYGVDLNPYAAAISRFRLVLSMMDKAGLTDVEQVPHDLVIHIYVDDALLAGKVGGAKLGEGRRAHQQFEFGDTGGGKAAGFQQGLGFTLLDPRVSALLSETRFDVVVGNPPYITEKDPAKRELIRQAFPHSAAGTFALAAPFVERLFELANAGGWMGQITANSFTKRQFGRKLVSEFLPTEDLTNVIDTSGAKLPGHGTPTIILIGRHRPPTRPEIRVVQGIRGERTPEGPLWKSISQNSDADAFQNEFISIEFVSREKLKLHPWSLGGGGVAELKLAIEHVADTKLDDFVEAIGRTTHTGEDDAFVLPPGFFRRRSIIRNVPLIEGEMLRDFSCQLGEHCFFPYHRETAEPEAPSSSRELAYLWPLRTTLRRRTDFGQTIEERGHAWWEQSMFFPARYKKKVSVAFPFVSTHNHFVLDRGGRVFKQTAPAIIFDSSVSEDRVHGVYAYLNSSAACFMLKQTCMNKGIDQENTWASRYEFDAAKQRQNRIPAVEGLVPFGRILAKLAAELDSKMPSAALHKYPGSGASLLTFLAQKKDEFHQVRAALCAVQEEVDWRTYDLLGLPTATSPELSSYESVVGITPQMRAFEVQMAVESDEPAAWFTAHSRLPVAGMDDASIPATSRALLRQRISLIDEHRSLQILESPDHKRRWEPFDWDAAAIVAARAFLLDGVEHVFAQRRSDARPLAVRAVARELDQQQQMRAVAEYLLGTAGSDIESLLGELMRDEAVASATAQVFTDAGIEKSRVWEATWALQRREDAGEKGLSIAVPPKYEKDDFEKAATVWRHRGKLDVPKERFIAYPTATPPAGASGVASLVFGWAGWTHLEQLQAAIALWQDEWAEHGNRLVPRATREAADEHDPAVVADRAVREKLLPILQTMVDLLPWVRQWHNDDGETADQFDSYVDEQCRLLDMSRDDVHLWRMPAKVKGPKKKATKKAKATAQAEDE